MVIGTMWHCALVSCTPSPSIGLAFGCAIFGVGVIWCYFYLFLGKVIFHHVVASVFGIFMARLLISNYTFRFSVNMLFLFSYYAPPWVFLPLDILFDYWIKYVTPGLICAMFRFSTRIFYRWIQGFATGCPCGIWCRWLTTCLLYVGQLLGNLVLIGSGSVSFT